MRLGPAVLGRTSERVLGEHDLPTVGPPGGGRHPGPARHPYGEEHGVTVAGPDGCRPVPCSRRWG